MAQQFFKSKALLSRLKPEIIPWLKKTVSKKRFEHIINVSEVAKLYAKKLKLDHYKAELSGLLHDLAKEIPSKKLLRLAKKKRIKLDKVDYKTPHILHARIGEVIAKEKFKIKDKDILGGIRCHTLAEPKMSPITMVVYLADATEPGRKRKKAAPIRKIFKDKGLEPAVLQAINNKLLSVIEKGGSIHPLTVTARNWLIAHMKTRKS